MRSVLYLIRKPPGVVANETVDLMLVSGVFEQPAAVVFVDDGVWQLVGDGALIGRKDTASALKALPAYDVDALYVDAASLTGRGVDPEDIDVPVCIIDTDAVTALLHDYDVVVSD